VAQRGDRRWLELLADHNTVVRTELARFRGREVKSPADGFLAAFDGTGCAIRAHWRSPRVRPLGIDIRVRLPI
jgi:class 3 adenylate cyclase